MFSWLCTRWHDNVMHQIVKLRRFSFSSCLCILVEWTHIVMDLVKMENVTMKNNSQEFTVSYWKLYLEIVHVNEIFYSRVLSVLKILSLDPQMLCPSITELFLLFWVNLCIFVCCSMVVMMTLKCYILFLFRWSLGNIVKV